MEERFANRREAGRILAEHLRAYADDPRALVLALPRGGVPVAAEIADALNLPLDVFIVRKLGVPGFEELAMGAIASGGARVLNEDVIRRLRISDAQIARATALEQKELERREADYRGQLPPPDFRDRTIIIVDDGLATGATMRAGIAALREAGAGQIIVAVPVGAPDTCAHLSELANQVVCPLQPEELNAVGAWYDDFSQTSDAEVRDLLSDRPHYQT